MRGQHPGSALGRGFPFHHSTFVVFTAEQHPPEKIQQGLISPLRLREFMFMQFRSGPAIALPFRPFYAGVTA